MRIREYKSLLTKALPKGKIILVVGPPGVGKTVVKQDLARSLGWDYIGICTPLYDPAFLMGFPYRENGTANFAPFGEMARALRADKPTLLDFDELPAASETLMKAALRLFQFREVGARKLPDCVILGASGNDVGHGSGVYGMIEPLKDRFDSIIRVEPHIDDTVTYGLARGWPADLLAYLRNSPDALHDWKPVKNLDRSGSTPRGWEMVASWIADGIDSTEVIAGCVGKGRAMAYLAFRELMAELPDIAGVLMSPETAPVPDNPSARLLISMALAAKIDGRTFPQALKYLQRLPAMFRAFSIRDAFRAEGERKEAGLTAQGYRPIHLCPDFAAWTCSDDGKNIMEAGV